MFRRVLFDPRRRSDLSELRRTAAVPPDSGTRPLGTAAGGAVRGTVHESPAGTLRPAARGGERKATRARVRSARWGERARGAHVPAGVDVGGTPTAGGNRTGTSHGARGGGGPTRGGSGSECGDTAGNATCGGVGTKRRPGDEPGRKGRGGRDHAMDEGRSVSE